LLIDGSGDILLMRLAFMEVRQCVSRERRIKVSFPNLRPSWPPPRLRAGTNMLVCEPP